MISGLMLVVQSICAYHRLIQSMSVSCDFMHYPMCISITCIINIFTLNQESEALPFFIENVFFIYRKDKIPLECGNHDDSNKSILNQPRSDSKFLIDSSKL